MTQTPIHITFATTEAALDYTMPRLTCSDLRQGLKISWDSAVRIFNDPLLKKITLVKQQRTSWQWVYEYMAVQAQMESIPVQANAILHEEAHSQRKQTLLSKFK